MGSDSHYPEEAPAHRVTVDEFWIDKYAVTNEQFGRFVNETSYVTVAERPPKAEDYPGAKPEMLRPASVVFRKPNGPVDLRITTTGGRMYRALVGDILKARTLL